jgi:hypothetical protein
MSILTDLDIGNTFANRDDFSSRFMTRSTLEELKGDEESAWTDAIKHLTPLSRS